MQLASLNRLRIGCQCSSLCKWYLCLAQSLPWRSTGHFSD